MKLGIVGGGVVGTAMARSFMEWTEVRLYDIVKEKSSHTLQEVLDKDVSLVFICLPTPQKEDSLECNLGYIERFFDNLTKEQRERNFVIRSTVPIGTTARLKDQFSLPSIAHSPEFLTARCSIADAHIPSRNIVGRVQRGTTWRTNSPANVLLSQLYGTRFPGVPVYEMTSNDSEAVKLFLNSFFAVKVAYFNEVYTVAEKLGLDWPMVMKGVLSDGRIAHAHTKVPGWDFRFGFGGTCLPKDLANLINIMDGLGLYPSVTNGAHLRNLVDRLRPAAQTQPLE